MPLMRLVGMPLRHLDLSQRVSFKRARLLQTVRHVVFLARALLEGAINQHLHEHPSALLEGAINEHLGGHARPPKVPDSQAPRATVPSP